MRAVVNVACFLKLNSFYLKLFHVIDPKFIHCFLYYTFFWLNMLHPVPEIRHIIKAKWFVNGKSHWIEQINHYSHRAGHFFTHIFFSLELIELQNYYIIFINMIWKQVCKIELDSNLHGKCKFIWYCWYNLFFKFLPSLHINYRLHFCSLILWLLSCDYLRTVLFSSDSLNKFVILLVLTMLLSHQQGCNFFVFVFSINFYSLNKENTMALWKERHPKRPDLICFLEVFQFHFIFMPQREKKNQSTDFIDRFLL